MPGLVVMSRAPSDFSNAVRPPDRKKYKSSGQWLSRKNPRAAPAPPHFAKKEVKACPLVRVICHSLLRPAGRGLVVIGSAQARNVTREKSEWGPQRQVVIFRGSEA